MIVARIAQRLARFCRDPVAPCEEPEPIPAPSVEPPAPVSGLVDHSQAYRHALDSVVWLTSCDLRWEIRYGTGVVIDAGPGIILTAYHVVGDDRLMSARFPRRDAEGEVIGDAEAYDHPAEHCVVLARDAKRDLALLMLKSPTGGLRTMIPAERSPRPGETLFLIGNEDQGPMWRFAAGHVRQVYRDRWTPGHGKPIDARILENSIPSNPGDSGGPLINAAGELVGIHSSRFKAKALVSHAIDVSEIRAFLAEIGWPGPD